MAMETLIAMSVVLAVALVGSTNSTVPFQCFETLAWSVVIHAVCNSGPTWLYVAFLACPWTAVIDEILLLILEWIFSCSVTRSCSRPT